MSCKWPETWGFGFNDNFIWKRQKFKTNWCLITFSLITIYRLHISTSNLIWHNLNLILKANLFTSQDDSCGKGSNIQNDVKMYEENEATILRDSNGNSTLCKTSQTLLATDIPKGNTENLIEDGNHEYIQRTTCR